VTVGAGRQILFPLDGELWPATVLDQYQDGAGAWRVVARVTTGPGATYVLVAPAVDCRAADDPPEGWVPPRRDHSSGPSRSGRSAADLEHD
jgi:hypothetical protein